MSSHQYSVDAAREFGWGSVTGDLHPERVAHLGKYLVGHKVLDAGCGGGGYVDFLSRQGLQVTGVDMHRDLLKNASENRRRGTYLQADVTSLPFPDKAFDSTYCFDVLEHVDDQLAVRELARVTRARLILAVPKKDEAMFRFGLTFGTYRDTTHLRYYTDADLEKLVRTIPNRGYSIVPELFIPLEALIRWVIEVDEPNSSVDHRLPTRWGTVTRLSTKFSRSVLRRMLSMSGMHRQVPSGLVGIVELQDPKQRPQL